MPTQSRQLAAIMFTDIVGYTRLMGKDSAKAMELVRMSKRFQKPLVERHHGKWLKEMGDGALMQFSSALDAVNCAVEIQRASRADFDAEIRIGIHLGDITIEDNDVYGDGVNVAARLESIADPGGIYISESIEKAIRGQSDIQAKFLGESQLKNVDYGVRTYALQGVGLPVPNIKNDKVLTGHFWAEVKRRGMIRSGLTYLVISALIALFIPYLQSLLPLPVWASAAAITALLIGFPIALYLAWNYERSREGFVRTSSEQSWQNPLKGSQRKPLTNNIIIIGMALIIALLFMYPGLLKQNGKEVDVRAEMRVKDKSIAVLPFADMSPNQDQEYFSDGIAEEIINALVQIPQLKVAARTSAFQFRGEEKDIKAIGKSLGVATILEGSVRKSNNRVRVTAQLINVADGFHLWSNTYERELNDIFAIQDELSKSIVDALQMQITDANASLVKDQTSNITAYNLYLQGKHFLSKRTGEGILKGIDFFEQAIEEDPEYALAYCGIADGYNVLSWWGYIEPLKACPKAKDAAIKALEINNSLGQAYTALALTQAFYYWDWDASEKSFLRALELSPNYGTAHHWYAILLRATGRSSDAMREIKKALELDPLSSIINFDVALHYLLDGNHQEALDQANKTLEINANFYLAHYCLYLNYYDMGDLDLAFDHFVQWRDNYGEDPDILKKGYSASGWSGAAELMIPILEASDSYVNPMYLALYYLHLNDRDKTLEYLEKAYDLRIPSLGLINHYPDWKSLYSEPRFKAIFKKMGLPPSSIDPLD